MTTSSRYPSAALGQVLGSFYDHRSLLRRTAPVFPVTWQDLRRALKGEAAMVPAKTADTQPSHRHNGLQTHAPQHARA